MHKLVELTLF